jgi:hypothetical protein
LQNTKKKCIGSFRTKAMEWWHTVHICIQLLTLQHRWSISTGSCLTTLLTALISLKMTTTCLPTWRADCELGMCKNVTAYRRQSSLTQAHKSLWLSASVPALTTLGIS